MTAPSPSTPSYSQMPPPSVSPLVLKTTKETHPNLPPGLVLGPDGKPCKACNSWRDWSKAFAKPRSKAAAGAQGDEGKKNTGGMAGIFAAAAGVGAAPIGSTATVAVSVDDDSEPPPRPKNCPPDNVELGRSTWTFLHTTAAYYPLTAPPSTQTSMLSLLSSISTLYPCGPCRDDFKNDLGVNPATEAVKTREGLMLWLCQRHNEVNEKLGKPAFGCERAQERWKDGPKDGSCD